MASSTPITSLPLIEETPTQSPAVAEPEQLAQEFLDSLSAATTGFDWSQAVPKDQSVEKKEWKNIQDFMESLNAATTGLEFSASAPPEKRTLEPIPEVPAKEQKIEGEQMVDILNNH